MEVYILENGLKWVVVARYGLKLWENEATRFRIIFKPEFWLKIKQKIKKSSLSGAEYIINISASQRTN